MTTAAIKAKDIKREWHLIDSRGKILGRMAVEIAQLLIGKNKVNYVSYLDGGDFVVVINTNKIVLSGNKPDQKMYYRHSGFPGGFKETPFAHQLAKDSREIIRHAVTGMLPKNKLRADRLARLKLFTEEKHDYTDKFKK